MKNFEARILGLALGGLLLLGAEARAVPISYTTTGAFVGGTGAQNDPVYTEGPITIQYLSNDTTSYDIASGGSSIADFGSFVVTTSGPIDTTVTANFTLTVLQALPTGGTASYPATLQGVLRVGASGASVTFTGNLSRTIGDVTYTIVENDGGIAGNAALVPATLSPTGAIIPGVTSIEARITVNPIPEPSAIILMGLGAIAPVGLMIRRKIRATA